MNKIQKLKVASWNFGSIGDNLTFKDIKHGESDFDKIKEGDGWKNSLPFVKAIDVKIWMWIVSGYWCLGAFLFYLRTQNVGHYDFDASAYPNFKLAPIDPGVDGFTFLINSFLFVLFGLLLNQVFYGYCSAVILGVKRLSAVKKSISHLPQYFWLAWFCIRALVPKWMPIRMNDDISQRLSYEIRSVVLQTCLLSGFLRGRGFADGVYKASRIAKANILEIMDGVDYYLSSVLKLGVIPVTALFCAALLKYMPFLTLFIIVLFFLYVTFNCLVRYFSGRAYMIALIGGLANANQECVDSENPPSVGGFMFTEELLYGLCMIPPLSIAGLKVLKVVGYI